MGYDRKGSAGHGNKNSKRKSPATVASIQTEYVRSLQRKMMEEMREKSVYIVD